MRKPVWQLDPRWQHTKLVLPILAFIILILITFTLSNPRSSHAPFSPTPDCPSPHSPRRTLTFPPSSTCVHPELSTDQLFLSICYDPTICNAFTLTVHRVGGTCDPGRTLSTDPDVQDAIVRDLGPEDFRLDVRGAEMYSTSDAVFADCTYRFHVALQNSGPASVQLTILHSNYNALDELSPAWPELVYQPLLLQPFLLPPCPLCEPYSAPPLPILNQLLSPSSLASYTSSHPSPLPPCPPSHPSGAGSYLPRPLHGVYSDPLPLIPKGQNLPAHFVGEYGYQPEGCDWQHGGTRWADHARCGRGGKRDGQGQGQGEGGREGEGAGRVAFLGDSHARVAVDALSHRLGGGLDYLTYSAKQGDKSYDVGETHITFSWDPHGNNLNDLELLSCDKLAILTTLVVCVGTHAAAFGESIAEFRETLGFIPRLAQCPGPLPTMILLLPPPMPPREDHFVREIKDQRTAPLLLAFGKVLKELGEANGWGVVDQMKLMRGFEEYPMETDQAHFLMTDGLEAVLDELVGKMGLCD